jgi:hypothetical protein
MDWLEVIAFPLQESLVNKTMGLDAILLLDIIAQQLMRSIQWRLAIVLQMIQLTVYLILDNFVIKLQIWQVVISITTRNYVKL